MVIMMQFEQEKEIILELFGTHGKLNGQVLLNPDQKVGQREQRVGGGLETILRHSLEPQILYEQTKLEVVLIHKLRFVLIESHREKGYFQ